MFLLEMSIFLLLEKEALFCEPPRRDVDEVNRNTGK